MTATRSTPRPPDAYHALVRGMGGWSERMELDEESDLGAVFAAFSATSAFGHAVGHGRRFLGYFEPGDGRTAHETGYLRSIQRVRRPAPPA